MHRPYAGFLPTAAFLLGLLATPFATATASAQGFSSVSSQSAATPAPASASAHGAVSLPAGSGFGSSPAAQPLPPPAPSAQVAALGFSSISGMSQTDAEQSATFTGAAGSNRAYETIDKIIVYKGDRVLQLLRGGRIVAEYPIKLGLNPFGHKQKEGDFRTPEGRYTINRRNPESEFFLSIQVSYPNAEDAAVARERGVPPGGLIMIHGQPNVPKKPPEFYATRDWTDGCIALSNAHMSEVWLRTPLGTPIEIRP